MTSRGFSAAKTAVPATMTLAPASAQYLIVFGATPPSTSMSRCGNLARSSATWRDEMRTWSGEGGSQIPNKWSWSTAGRLLTLGITSRIKRCPLWRRAM